MDKQAFYSLSYGVYLCTTWDEGRPVGCVANSAMQITSVPATIAVSINRNNYTHGSMERCGYFALTVLAEDSDPSLIGKFGFFSGKNTNKFDGVPYAVRGSLPVVDDGAYYFVCKIVGKTETSTHTVFLGEVTDAQKLRGGTPMTYAYYHKVLKGKTAVNAPTYVDEPRSESESAAGKKYVCSVCGYEYDGEIPFAALPADWTCPVCGVGKDKFVLA